MLIKFVKPDPRAGMVVQMDSLLGHQMIEAGNAVAHKDSAESKAESEKAATTATAPAKGIRKAKAK